MKKTPLWIFIILSALFLWLGTVFFPYFRVWPMAPLLAILFHRTTFIQALWGSFLCGLVLDLTSSQFPFGLLAVTHSLTTVIGYAQKKHFFEDKMTALSLYSALLSMCLSSILVILSSLIEKQVPLSPALLVSDLLVMPLLDAAYAFVWFTIPVYVYYLVKRRLLLKNLSNEDTG